ncbi:hypothetical protein SAMN04515674_110143 [Pseudarcicella hirudinis]|uniref:Uncharacterized protein n=1 Tax=Pseudarcicella hirudinis TaxID=1079859 RepID=A0A1I5VYQ6_9BACT|nr:hypothetical protein [Pseudarcicella hirudinis]SFQ12615.1 hypothetical protein SAMN04515674_110143 [Pseudarcicella hirudinis]
MKDKFKITLGKYLLVIPRSIFTYGCLILLTIYFQELSDLKMVKEMIQITGLVPFDLFALSTIAILIAFKETDYLLIVILLFLTNSIFIFHK